MGVKGDARASLLALLWAEQGAGGPLQSPETNCKKMTEEKPPGAEPRTEKDSRDSKKEVQSKRERVSHEHCFMQRRA